MKKKSVANKKRRPTTVGSGAVVSLRLTLDDVRFIINELRSCAAVGATDPAYTEIPKQLEKALDRHEAKQANEKS